MVVRGLDMSTKECAEMVLTYGEKMTKTVCTSEANRKSKRGNQEGWDERRLECWGLNTEEHMRHALNSVNYSDVYRG